MHNRFARFFLVLGVMSGAAAVAHAQQARTFTQTTQKDFEEGEVSGTTVLPPGTVVAGLEAHKVPLETAFVWCSARSPDGQTVYFGTGDAGQIFAVPAAAPAHPAKQPTAHLLATLPEPWITALVTRADGSLLAATTPGARIYRIDPKSGHSKPIARMQSDHVWALVHDPRTGTTFAGTGGDGKIAAIDRNDRVTLLWDSQDQHVVSLVDDGAGNLLAGTSEQAILYRVNKNGKAHALHDFEANEVRAIARQGDMIYVAVNAFTDTSGASPPTVPASGNTAAEGTQIEIVSSGRAPAAPGRLPRPGAPKAKGAVYRLLSNGSVEQLFSLADGYFTALLADENGGVHATAGSEGKVYHIAADRTVALVLDLPERQALTIQPARPSFLIGTGDLGSVHRVGPATTGKAVYLSRVFDARQPSRWGQLRYGANQKLTVETRAGNTSKPDDNWDAWRPLGGHAFSGLFGEGAVASPSARYLQYRVNLGDKSALRNAIIYYLPHNQRARVIEFSEDGAGKPMPADGRGDPKHDTVLKLRWKMDNPDGDALIYHLSYRPEGPSNLWRPLGGPDPLTKAEFDWNTESVPDGHYVVRIWASDVHTVAQNRALNDEYLSPPLLIDNTRPEIADLRAALPDVTGTARDATSVITLIQFSVDGGPFVPVSPVDGILDQREEKFSLRLNNLPPGAHVVTVRAYDAAHNLGVSRIVVHTR